ncbi:MULTISPECIES: transposase [unclassified Bradyrhizobium]|uniref:IS66 family transposase n=1 Tax=unclassified Bradyrhizobium TaxID=2631580 RepID=UPI00396476D5
MSGPKPPAAIYLFAPDRKAERPAAHLAAFKGILHVDGYAGFEQLADKEGITLAACWSHSRRKTRRGRKGTASQTPMALPASARAHAPSYGPAASAATGMSSECICSASWMTVDRNGPSASEANGARPTQIRRLSCPDGHADAERWATPPEMMYDLTPAEIATMTSETAFARAREVSCRSNADPLPRYEPLFRQTMQRGHPAINGRY